MAEQDKRQADDGRPVLIANPAEPAAPTAAPVATADRNRSLVGDGAYFTGFPKTKYHPVHGAVVVNSPNEEASLSPPTDYFDTPQAADAARTWTEAEAARISNVMKKLQGHADAGHEVVRNSVQADESLRRGGAEPL